MSITTETRFDSLVKTNKSTICNKILEILKDDKSNYGLTAREISSALYFKGFTKDKSRQYSQPRLTELVDAGKVIVVGKKYDILSDRMVASYALKV